MADEAVSFKLPHIGRESLTCIECSNYLSIAPIVYHGNGLLCGRCVPKYSTAQRATAYETLAQLFCFPCKNLKHGCMEEFKWNYIELHEAKCEFSIFSCPAIVPGSVCQWSGRKNLLLDHFFNFHRDLLIFPSKYVDLPHTENITKDFLLVDNDSCLLLQMINNVHSGKCWFGMSSISQPTVAVTTYSIQFKSFENSAKMVLQGNIEDVMASKIDKMFPVDIDGVKAFLKSNNIICTVKIDSDARNTQKSCEAVMKGLECFICLEYMVPPIFMCIGGHSICSSCQQNGTLKCPLCQSDITNIRNFQLEHVTEMVEYPNTNKNSYCSLEKQCHITDFNCPFKCGWDGKEMDLICHIRENHSKFSRLNEKLFAELKNISSENYLFRYDNKIFQLYIRIVRDSNLKKHILWALKEINCHFKEKPRYKYSLTFIDQTKKNKNFIANSICYGIGGVCEIFNKCIQIPYHQLEPYITEEKVAFQLYIGKMRTS